MKIVQVQATYSISAGLDHPGVCREHAFLKEKKRVLFSAVTDMEALEAFLKLSKTQGDPALEPAHAVAHAMELAPTLDRDDVVVVALSGRGNKDVDVVGRYVEANTSLEATFRELGRRNKGGLSRHAISLNTSCYCASLVPH